MGPFELQWGVETVIWLVMLLVSGFALVDAVTRPAQAFVATDKLTKVAWLWITGAALAGIVVFGVLHFIGLIATVAVFVYLLDVRPAVAAIMRRGS